MSCDFCNETKVLISQELENGILMDIRFDDDHNQMDVCAGIDENHMEWGDSLDINFCPKCGRRLNAEINPDENLIYVEYCNACGAETEYRKDEVSNLKCISCETKLKPCDFCVHNGNNANQTNRQCEENCLYENKDVNPSENL